MTCFRHWSRAPMVWRYRRVAGVMAALLVAVAHETRAQVVPEAATDSATESLRAALRLPDPPAMAPAPQQLPRRYFPGISASSPSAYGAEWGDAFVGAGYQARARHVNRPDGVVAAGFGLGSARRFVALQVDVISFSTIRSGWLNRAAVDLKAHRHLPGEMALAVGWETAARTGPTDGSSSVYVVASKLFPLRANPYSALGMFALSLGAGDGRFRSENQWRRGDESPNLFGSAALQVFPVASLIADWTGQDLALALSVVPLPSVPVVVIPGVVDLTGNAGDGARFVVGASWQFLSNR